MYLKDDLSFSLFCSFKSKTPSPPFPSTPHEEETLIFLYSSSSRKTPWIPVSFRTSMRRIRFYRSIKTLHFESRVFILSFFCSLCFVLWLICILTVLYFCTFASSLHFFFFVCLMLGAYCKRLTVCLERRELWLDNQPDAEQKLKLKDSAWTRVSVWEKRKIGKAWNIWMFVIYIYPI